MKAKFADIGLKACRYYDDYYLYVSTKDEADRVLKGLQLILTDFQLEINESKVRIKEFPFSFEDEFTTTLFLFDFKKTNLNNSLKHYFSLIWGFAEKNPKKADWIFKYSLRIFEFRTIEIPKSSWKLFENMLFKTALVEPSILDIVTRILLTYNSFLDIDSNTKLKNLITIIINDHSPINHNFEISWALWIAKTFNIEIEESTANKIIETKDSIANLILLDLLKNTTLIQGHPQINKLEVELKDDVLFSENWLLAYEGVKKGWLVPASASLLDDNLFFKLLKDLDVEFYNTTNQLIPYEVKKQNTQPVPPSASYEGLMADAQNPENNNIPKTADTLGENQIEFVETIPSGLYL